MSTKPGCEGAARRVRLRLHAGEPDELAAGRTRVGHSKIADKRDEAALPVNRAAGTNRRGLGVDRFDLQRPPRGRTGNPRRPRFMAGHGRLAIVGNVPPEQAVVKIGPSLQNLSQMVAYRWRHPPAKVAELADAPDLGSGSRKALGVRLPPFALLRSPAFARELRSASTNSRRRVRRSARREGGRSGLVPT